MGEMGYLHLKVHGLVNLDERVNGESRPNQNRALFSAELVTSDYRFMRALRVILADCVLAR